MEKRQHREKSWYRYSVKLIFFYDFNRITIEGKIELSYSDDVPARYKAHGWHVQEIDGHNRAAIAAALGLSKKTVEVHRANVMRKTRANSLAELVRMHVAAKE